MTQMRVLYEPFRGQVRSAVQPVDCCAQMLGPPGPECAEACATTHEQQAPAAPRPTCSLLPCPPSRQGHEAFALWAKNWIKAGVGVVTVAYLQASAAGVAAAGGSISRSRRGGGGSRRQQDPLRLTSAAPDPASLSSSSLASLPRRTLTTPTTTMYRPSSASAPRRRATTRRTRGARLRVPVRAAAAWGAGRKTGGHSPPAPTPLAILALSPDPRYLNTDFDTFTLERKVGDFHCPANNRKDILDDGGCVPDNTRWGEKGRQARRGACKGGQLGAC